MGWYIVDKKYINYLTQFDSCVGYVEYGERLKLHVGILLTIGNFHYYVPISSAHAKRSQTIFERLNLSNAQPKVLYILRETDGYTQKELASICRITPHL